jgi:hypothetical protein
MDWPDWSTVQIARPGILPWVGLCALVGLAVLVLPSRHGRAAVTAAAVARCLAIAMLVFAVAGLVSVRETTTTFEPQGTWRLALPGAQLPPGEARDFDTGPESFVAEVRDALALGTPPAMTEVHGPSRESILPVQARLEALGVPCRTVFTPRPGAPDAPVLTGIEAPQSVQPGEAFHARVAVGGAGATFHLTLDGKPVALTDGLAELRVDEPGRHVLEAVLRDEEGNELQRAGHVLRVGERPLALAIDLTPEQLQRAATLAPDLRMQGISGTTFGPSHLQGAGIILISADGLYQLTESQAESLAGFVALGGGLFITGDGAKYVAPEYLFAPARRLLPVVLHKEAKRPPEDEPPVEREDGLSEITKISICFVIDNSGSMDLPVGRSGKTRWEIATRGVLDSIELIRKGGRHDAAESELAAVDTRVTVISFTLKQERVYGPLEVFKGSVGLIERALTVNRKRDNEYAEGGYNTDIYAAMENALDVMEQERAAIKMIVMLTDGADRPKTTLEGKRHADLRARAVRNDINIMAIGIGDVFSTSSPEADAARDVIEALATDPTYARIPVADQAEKASAIFVEAAEVSFAAFEQKKKEAEEARKEALKQLEDEGKEPPKVDVMPGVFPLRLHPIGRELFGPDVLPEDAPKVQWLARNEAREGAAVALSAATDDGDTPALVFRGFGMGRVAFWGAGTDPEALGELTGWGEFPAVFASSLRWLLPREQPDLRLVGEGTPAGIRLLDPLEGARYRLRTTDASLDLRLDGDRLLNPAGPLPVGPGEVLEVLDGEERAIGDVYIAEVPAPGGRLFATDNRATGSPLQVLPPRITEQSREATLPILYVLTALLLIMPLERLVRRRT